jgi:peptidoglycan/LPS O-acetylase OafA/YrhL
LLLDIKSGVFSLSNFYERRCRRILPPLFFMAFTVAVFSAIVMLPTDFLSFGSSLAAMSTFMANIFFYFVSGYWESSTYKMPLLHTWSLAVEEQFYLCFPLLIWGGWHLLGRKNVGLFIALGASISFLACVFRLPVSPDAVFYWPQYRAWELLMGAGLAVISPKRLAGALLKSVFGFIGLGLIIFAAVTYTPESPVPGWAAIPPCFGALLLLYSHIGGVG